MIWRNEDATNAVNNACNSFSGWQVMKSQIIAELGQAEILLPSLVTEGLAANDRIKVRMSALQAAAQHAQEPARPATDLHVECRAAARVRSPPQAREKEKAHPPARRAP